MADLKRRIIAEFSAKNKAKGVLSGFRRDMDTTGRALRRMAVGALAVAGVGGLGYMLKKQMEVIDSTAKLSRRLNIATEDLIAMQHGAGIAGVEQETFNKSLEIFIRRLGEVDMGVGQATYALDKLGLNYKDLIGLSADEAFGKIADQIRGLATQAEKAAAANYLFGRSGQLLLNFFEKGSEGLKEYKEFVEKTGLAFSDFDAAQVEAANDALMNVRAAMSGIFRQATIELAPFIEIIANKFVDLATAGEGVGPKVVGAFETMSKAAINVASMVDNLNASLLDLTADAHEFINVWQSISAVGAVFGLRRAIKGDPSHGQIADKLRYQAKALRRAQAEDLNAVEKFYQNLREKAAGKATKTIKEQYADTLQAKIALVDLEIAENERRLVEAKKSADEEKKIIVDAARDRIDAIRSMDFATRTERIQELEAYVAANEDAMARVGEANKLLKDEIDALERDKWAGVKKWGREARDIYLQLDQIAVSSFDRMADALTDLCLRGKADFGALAQSVLSDLTRMIIKMQMAQLLGFGGGGVPMWFSAGVGGALGGLGGGPPAGTRIQNVPGTISATYLQGGGEVVKTGWAKVHRGETYSGVGRGEVGGVTVNVNNDGMEKFEVSQAAEYWAGDQRVVDIFITKAQTDGGLRRAIKEAAK